MKKRMAAGGREVMIFTKTPAATARRIVTKPGRLPASKPAARGFELPSQGWSILQPEHTSARTYFGEGHMGGIRQSLKHARKIKSSQIRKRAEQEFAICFIGRDEMDRAALLRVFLPEGTPRAERDRAVGFIRSTLA